MSLQSPSPHVQMESPSSPDSHQCKQMQKENNVIGIPERPEHWYTGKLMDYFNGLVHDYFSMVKPVNSIQEESPKAFEPHNINVHDTTHEDVSLKKSKKNYINNDTSKMILRLVETDMKKGNDASGSQQKQNKMSFDAVYMYSILMSIGINIKKVLQGMIFFFLFIPAGATSDNCNLQFKDSQLIATWKPTDRNHNDFVVDGKPIVSCIPKFKDAHLYPKVDSSKYRAIIEEDGTCKVFFSLPPLTEMFIQIESKYVGLGSPDINGQHLRCNNGTMAWAYIKVVPSEAETDGSKGWIVFLVVLAAMVTLVYIGLLYKICIDRYPETEQQTGRQNQESDSDSTELNEQPLGNGT